VRVHPATVPPVPNRLASTSSPYLLAHADNPVDWWPWGEEALAEARRRNVPLLVSIGYSACHWCHVMAHESFEDEAIAREMNEHFVCVKVDREERPDLDEVYMTATVAMTGSGGWPMTVFCTPDGTPFYAGTYFPPTDRHGLPAFRRVLEAIADAWEQREDELVAEAARLAEGVAAHLERRTAVAEGEPDSSEVDPDSLARQASAALARRFDADWGGFGTAPKFPQPVVLRFLLRHHLQTGDTAALQMVRRTLRAMANGGIHDHLGGGFARYSTDRFWRVPHFEKMLYDQALLLDCLVDAWSLTGEEDWAWLAEDTVAYLTDALLLPEGGFAASEDADSGGGEGRYWTWTPEEVRAALPAEMADAAIAAYGVGPAGHLDDGRSVLHRPLDADVVPSGDIATLRAHLAEARRRREPPTKNDTVIVEWNAMLVAALASGAVALDRDDWSELASGTADFLCRTLRDETGTWHRTWRAGRLGPAALAVDHAWLLEAFCRLAEATLEARWLEEARSVASALQSRFVAPDGLVATRPLDGERLFADARDVDDSATPPANAVAGVALARFAALAGDDGSRAAAERIWDRAASIVAAEPAGHLALLELGDLVVHGTTELVVTGDRPDLVACARRFTVPRGVLVAGGLLQARRGATPEPEGLGGNLAAICRNFVCHRPVSTEKEFSAALEALSARARRPRAGVA